MKQLLTTTRINPKRDIWESILVGVILTTLSYVVAFSAQWVTALNLLEIFAVFTSYACTYLCVKERRANYPIGAISTAAYAILFMQSGLLSSAILNIYLTPTLIYGWLRWRQDAATRPVTHVALKWVPVYALVALLGYAGAALISQAFGGTMAWTDAMILAGTILAQFLLDNKKTRKLGRLGNRQRLRHLYLRRRRLAARRIPVRVLPRQHRLWVHHLAS